MPISLRTLCLVTAVLCNVQRSLEHEIPRRSFLSRRAIDGTRGRKYFDPSEEGVFDSYGSAGGQYDPYDHVTDLSDIRKNVPGEPGVDYPAYSTLPQTGFTCEGRSRGYYADEAAGCQVFHVCHDVLVSSFLCPIGSTFSQKLLTCDWWTKVDCSATSRYLAVNRNHYQIDDDEMIRNAYVMISLQSAEDVTKDGLVDPDSGARIIDYSALGVGRTAGYTPGYRRITDYPAVDATGNDLPSGYEDYLQRDDRQTLDDYDRYQEKIAKSSPAYQSKFHLAGRSPYHASPVIRHGYQAAGEREFQDDYRRPDGFTNRLQASYAPTVPTVTTTTRRLYSPTVPTTYRPSTLAYNKLDLLMDGSDHLYAHSKSPATPPTVARQRDDLKNVDSTRHDDDDDQKTFVPSLKSPGADDREGGRLGFEDTSQASFRLNETINEDEVFRQQNDRPVVRDDESAEDIETKDSIGIAQALNSPRGRIIVRSQDPVVQVLKSERRAATALAPSSANRESYDGASGIASPTQTLKKPLVTNETGGSTEDHVTTTRSRDDETAYTRSFGDRTTPLLARDQQPRNDDSSRESAISITAKPATSATERVGEKITDESVDRSPSKENQTATADQSSSPTKSLISFDDEPLADLGFPRPALFLRPPLGGFLINVPDETPYTTLDDSSFPATTTTEVPRFSPADDVRDESYNENINEQSLVDYADEGLSATTPRPEVHPADDRLVIETSTPIAWLVSSWHDRSVPVTDIAPPVVDYNDGYGDFVPPDANGRSHTTQFDRGGRVESLRDNGQSPKNNSETEIRYNTGFQFTIRDAVKAQEPKTRSPCRSSAPDERARLCETSPVGPRVAVSTPDVEEKAVLIGAKTNVPEQLVFSADAEKPVTPVPGKSLTPSTPVARSSVTVVSDVDVEGVTLKAVTPRDVFRTNRPEEKIEEATETVTSSGLLHPTRPGSLKQIEETIDRQNSPYEVSLTVKRDEDLDTTAGDFISRLIAQHQQPAAVLRDHLGDFEIVKSVEPEDEVTAVSRSPSFPDASRTSSGGSNSGSLLVSSNNVTGQSKDSESNVSMLSLLQLMAELLKLDRLPRPFSTKDLRNAELGTSDLDESPFVTTNPLPDHSRAETPFKHIVSKAPVFDILNAGIAEPKVTSPGQERKQPFVTTNPLPDHSRAETPFKHIVSKAPVFDILNAGIAEPKVTSPGQERKQPFVTTNPLPDHSRAETPFKHIVSKTSVFDTLNTPTNIAEPKVTSPGQEKQLFVTTNPLFDHSRTETPFQHIISKSSVFDILNAGIAESKVTSPSQERQQSFVTTSPLLDHSRARTPFGNGISKTPAFDSLRTNAKPKTPPNLDGNKPSSIIASPSSYQSDQTGTVFTNAVPKASAFNDTSRTTSNVALTLSPDVFSRTDPDHATETKASRSKAAVGRANRPFQKQEILEQLTENFGQPLYRGDSVHRSLVFDLPQVQRSLDFETGLPIDESERVVEEAEEASSTTMITIPTTTTTTTTTQRAITTAESERTIVETEFVPSIGFSFDTDEGREEYVEAILGGLIDDHGGRNESSVAARFTHDAPKNATLRPERDESSGDV